MQRGFPCGVKSTKLPFSQLLLRLVVRLSSSQLSEAGRETAQGRRRRRLCFSSCALGGSTAKESAQPSPLLSHPLIHKRKRWVCQEQTLNTETATHTEPCSYPYPPSQNTSRHRTSRQLHHDHSSWCKAQILLLTAYLNTLRCCLTQAY